MKKKMIVAAFVVAMVAWYSCAKTESATAPSADADTTAVEVVEAAPAEETGRNSATPCNTANTVTSKKSFIMAAESPCGHILDTKKTALRRLLSGGLRENRTPLFGSTVRGPNR